MTRAQLQMKDERCSVQGEPPNLARACPIVLKHRLDASPADL